MKIVGLRPKEKIEDFSFSLSKTKIEEDFEEDCTTYLDTRMCQSRTNKGMQGEGKEYFYVFRKIKIGTWAKTSMREEATFKLSVSIKTSGGREAVASSEAFEIFSHQSQLRDKRGVGGAIEGEDNEGKTKTGGGGGGSKRGRHGGLLSDRTALSKSLDSAMLQYAAEEQANYNNNNNNNNNSNDMMEDRDDVFGLFSLSDAALKLEAAATKLHIAVAASASSSSSSLPAPALPHPHPPASEDTSPALAVFPSPCASSALPPAAASPTHNAELKRICLLDKADDLRKRILALQEEENALRAEAAKLYTNF